MPRPSPVRLLRDLWHLWLSATAVSLETRAEDYCFVRISTERHPPHLR